MFYNCLSTVACGCHGPMAATRSNKGGKGSDTRGLTAPANQDTLSGP